MADVLDSLVAVVAVLSIFALPLIVALIILVKKIGSSHRERLGLIEQGIIPPNESKRKSNPNRYRSLRNGVILIALGIGILVSFLLNNYIETNHSELLTIAPIILFLGIGYVAFFLMTKRNATNTTNRLDNELEDDAELL